jgi:nucleoid-associated protein YgaU
MNKFKLTGILLLFVVGILPLSAAEGDAVYSDFINSLLNNKYLLENNRLIGLAEKNYAEGKYDDAVKYAEEAIQYAQMSDDWIAAQKKVKETDKDVPAIPHDIPASPAQYLVRSWQTVKDCLWNIAAKPQIYGNPYQWRVIYNANKAKLPEPENPHLIHPGMILDIPSLKGETRHGILEE